MAALLEQVRRTLALCDASSAGGHILAAVSGGADSVCLMHVLHALAKPLRLTLTIAHLNHRIRGADAAEDARFVAETAARLGLPCVTGSADVPRRARRTGESLEMAARAARYAFLARTARRLGADAVATAHTRDDQAETVLLRLVRGAGLDGLAAMAADSRRPGIRLIRPLLDISRDQVVAFLEAGDIAWREDASNRDPRYQRNRVRQEILPLLERTLNPRVRETLARTARLLRAEAQWLEQLAAERLEQCRTRIPGEHSEMLELAALREQPVAARRRIIRLWLRERKLPEEKLGFALIERVDRLCLGRSGTGRLELSDGRQLVRRYGRLAVAAPPRSDEAPLPRTRVTCRGLTRLPEWGLSVYAATAPGLVRQKGRMGAFPAEATLNRAAIGRRALYVRSWVPGDRMSPLGLRGSRKLQDIFVDAKIPVARRGRIPLFVCDGEIVWMPGYRVAQGWEVVDPALPALHLRVEDAANPVRRQPEFGG